MNNSPLTPDFSPDSYAPAQEEIALRAHQLWCQQGCPLGHDVDNWLEAERQLLSEYGNRTVDTPIPTREDVPLSRGGGLYSSLRDEAPLAARVEEELTDSPRSASRQSPTSLEL